MIRKKNWFGFRWGEEPYWKDVEGGIDKYNPIEEIGEAAEGSYMCFGVVDSHIDEIEDLFWQVIIPIKIREPMDLFYLREGRFKRVSLKEGRPYVFNMTRSHGVVQSKLPKDTKVGDTPTSELLYNKENNTAEVRALAIAFKRGELPEQFKKFKVR